MFRKIEVECDNFLLVELLNLGGGDSSSVVEVRLIHQLFFRDWNLRIRHVSRIVDGVVDVMDKVISVSDSRLHLFQSPSDTVNDLLQKNIYDVGIVSI